MSAGKDSLPSATGGFEQGTAPMRSGRDTSGPYELLERLGRDNRTEVWKAHDLRSSRLVAIKLFFADLRQDPDFLPRFLQQSEAVASLHHPNVAQVSAYAPLNEQNMSSRLRPTAGQQIPSGACAYLVMEYVEGERLTDYIAGTSRQGKFPPAEELAPLFASICAAVDYAHAQGIIHRNITPASILISSGTQTPKLTDFGMFKVVGPAPSAAPYMAPEQAQGYPGNERSDIYALGAILYELCTGVPPFSGDTPTAILRQHIANTPTSPVLINTHIPPALTMAILRSLSKDPSARFTTASALAAALADALNQPLPEDVPASAYPPDAMSEPTFYKPLQSDHSLPGMTPYPTPTSSSPSFPGPSVTPHLPAASGPTTPMPPSLLTPTSPYAPSLPGEESKQAPVSKRRQRPWLIALAALLVLVLLGSGLGAFFLLNAQSGPPATSASKIFGESFFVSSGQVSENGNQGINDQLQINLRNISDPAPGTRYYVWLLHDTNQPDAVPLLLGMLKVTHRAAHFFYAGNAQHANLLAFSSRVLITAEDANIVPINPSPDHSTWRYIAEIPQMPNPNDAMHSSLLDHLRVLLADDPTLASAGQHGGSNIWLQRNTGKILEWAGSARDYWQSKSFDLMHAHFIRILEYLDGNANVQADLPAGTQSIVSAPLALIGTDQDITASDYLHEISGHLNAIAQAPGVTPAKRKLATQINTEMNHVRTWLEKVRMDAKTLISMSPDQLRSQDALLLLDDMVTQAFYAYAGQIDPSTNQVQAGVIQISDDIERLATIDVTAYNGK